MAIENLIIGNQLIKTEAQRRKILLGGYLILINIGMGLFFFVVSLFNPAGDPSSIFTGFFISTLCLVLLRMGYTDLALVIHFIRANGFAFYFALKDENVLMTGTYMLFLPASLGALAVFGYTERWKGISFASVSLLLFLIALLRPENFYPGHAHFYFIMYFLIVLLIGLLIMLFFDQLVIKAEQKILDKNKELIKTNAELDRFVYSASHDLRAPLSSIMGLINISKNTNNPDEVKQYLALMEGRIQHLDLFIHEIIDYSRNARLEIEKNKVNLKSLIEDVVDSLKFSDGASRLKIEMSVPPQLEIMTDASRLKAILANLVSNSIRYADFAKKDPFIFIEVASNGPATKICVKDNGQGIAPEHQPKIFDMFYRASSNSKGSGLGLYIVKETLTRIGGSIEIDSEFGRGSAFTVELVGQLK